MSEPPYVSSATQYIFRRECRLQSISYHLVRPGDTTYRIMRDHYGTDRFLGDKKELTEAVQAVNPRMADINLIRPGQIVVLPPVSRDGTSLELLAAAETNEIRHAALALGRTDALALDAWVTLAPRTAGDFGRKSFDGTLKHIQKVTAEAVGKIDSTTISHRLMQSGKITRSQYNYRRRIRLDQADKQLGILRHSITPGKKTREIIRVDRNATNQLHRHIGHLQKLERIIKVAKTGVVVLKVTDLADTGAKLSLAKDDQERTLIVLDEFGSASGAAAAVAGTKFILFVAGVATPAGWLGIACFAVVAAIGGGAGEAISKAIQEETLYDEQGRRMNSLLDKIWKAF